MSPVFDELKKKIAAGCAGAFGERLSGLYLTGSFFYGDAVPGVSDLDCFAVLEHVRPEDGETAERAARELDGAFPEVNGAHITVFSEKQLADDPFGRFMLRYNSMLLSGRDIVKDIDDASADSLRPDARTAALRLPFARKCLEDAMAGRQPECTGEIPNDPAYAARKLARYFVIVEGAYFLMSRGRFASFSKEDVLSGLRGQCPGFEAELDLAGRVLADPVGAGVDGAELMGRIYPLTKYMLDAQEREAT